MAVFNIVHLTDLHFGQVSDRKSFTRQWVYQGPPTHNLQRAEHLAAWLYEKTDELEAAGDRLDALVLSGDLATTGIPDDLRTAFKYIDGPATNLYYRDPEPQEAHKGRQHFATISGLARRCILIPGNHDRYKSNYGEPAGAEFNNVFDKYWNKHIEGVVGTVLSKPSNGTLECLAVIGADACLRDEKHATPFCSMSQGYAYPEMRDALVNKTKAIREVHPNIAVIWFIHFPPWPVFPALRMLQYQIIAKASADWGVAVVLSGHTHLNTVLQPTVGTTIWKGGSATQYRERKGHWIQYLEVEVQSDRIVGATRTNLRWTRIGNLYDYFLVGQNFL
jgi:predicted MPP superfamily phosphohydrolase